MSSIENNHYPSLMNSIDSHEERLQRVESNLMDVAENTATLVAQQTHLSKSIEQVVNQISIGFDKVSEAHSKFQDKLDIQKQFVDTQLARIAPLEQEKSSTDARNNNIKKAVWAIVLAGAGILGTKGVEYFLTHWK
jgi:chromosome segregation ATPase